jgi:hypothetical protein
MHYHAPRPRLVRQAALWTNVVDVDWQEAALVVMGVQGRLLMAVNDINRVRPAERPRRTTRKPVEAMR